MVSMCRLSASAKELFENLPNISVFIVCFVFLTSGVNSQFNFKLHNTIQSARHNNCSNCKRILDLSIAEKRRLDIIMKQIINKLEIEPRTKTGQDARIKPRDSTYKKQKEPMYIQPKQTYPEMAEIVSFPEKHDNTSSKNTLLFTINVRNTPEQLEAIKVNLWVLLKQRKKGRTRGKKIWLRVSKIDNENNTSHYLTSIRTRVKKTRWQKIGLPVTHIQSMLDDNQPVLKLKVSCKKCGKMVRPVLKRRLHRKRRHKGKKNKRRNMALNRRNRSFKNTDSIQPFLVISTRYKHKIKR